MSGLLCLLCLSACRSAGPRAPEKALDPGSEPSFTGAQLAEDFSLLRQVVEQLHPGLYRYNTKASVEASFRTLLGAVEHGASPGEAYRALSVFLATIRCGHTYANFFNQPKRLADRLFRSGATRVPFWFVWRGEGMVVTRDFTAGALLPPGTEVLALDGVPAPAILSALLAVARADGSNDRKRVNGLEIHGDTDLEAFDIYFPLFFPQRVAGRYLLSVRSPSGAPSDVPVEALTFPQRLAPVQAALAARRGGEAPIWTLSIEGQGAWLTMPTWALYQSRWDWKEFLRQSFLALQQRRVRDLVIDLRGNEGGLAVGDVLLPQLVRAPLRLEPLERRVRYRRVPDSLLPVLDTWDPSFKDWGAAAAGPVDGFYRLTRSGDGDAGPIVTPVAQPFAGKVWVVVDASNSSATFEFAQVVPARAPGHADRIGHRGKPARDQWWGVLRRPAAAHRAGGRPPADRAVPAAGGAGRGARAGPRGRDDGARHRGGTRSDPRQAVVTVGGDPALTGPSDFPRGRPPPRRRR